MRVPGFRFGILDRYILGLALKPLGVGVGVLLVALLLGRVLRLVNLLAANGSTEFGLLALLTASLVPHYLGLAVSAAFVVAVFIAMIRLGDGSELDALLSSGRSLGRIAVPFVGLGLALALLSFVLYGWLNPLSRYDYRSVLHSANAAAYRTDVQPGAFVNAGNGTTVTAERVDAEQKRLEDVFVYQSLPDGREKITTARAGEALLADDGIYVKLVLLDGTSVIRAPDAPAVRSQFRRLNVATEIEFAGRPFRPRGESEREMTLPELWRALPAPPAAVPRPVLEAELVDRIVRPLSLLLMPFLAMPLSLATKRGSRAAGLVAGAVLLVTLNNALQFGKDLAAGGFGPPLLTVGGPFMLFVALTAWLFARSSAHPTEAPLSGLFSRAGGLTRALRRRRARRRQPA